MLTPRPYQLRADANLRELYQAGARRICLVSPTGSGKTFIAGRFTAGALAKGSRVQHIAHRIELLKQPLDLLTSMGLRCGVIKSGYDPDPTAPIQIASIQTLARRGFPETDIVVIDEGHRSTEPSYDPLFDAHLVLGLTATPWRLDGRGLGSRYTHMLEVAKPSELLADGYIAEIDVYAPDVPRLRSERYQDLTTKESGLIMDTPRLVGNAVDHWMRLARGKSTVVYASTVAHAIAIQMRYQAAGIDAHVVSGVATFTDRRAILNAFRARKFPVLINVELLTEGWDFPGLECVQMLRITASLSKHLQMVGRLSRPGVPKILLDHAGNTIRHGLPNTDHEWSLTGKEQRHKPSTVRVCHHCMGVVPIAATRCGLCGESLSAVAEERRIPKEVKRELVRKQVETRQERMGDEAKRELYRKLLAKSRAAKHRDGAAAHKYKALLGEFPPFEWRHG